MQRIASLLDPKNPAYSLRRALVRLWVLASDPVRLNSWEQASNEASIAPQIPILLSQLDSDVPIDIQLIETQPLALIRALDDYLSGTTQARSRFTFNPGIFSAQEEGKDYWLVPVHLAARRQAVIHRQPARLARWFHRHAVLPAVTKHNVEVKVRRSRSMLDKVLHQLSTEPDAMLKVWLAHFTDGADVEWDTSLSPVGNWRTRCVAPSETRLASMLQALKMANEAGAHVVVFPEFSLDLQHRTQLAQFLRQNPSAIQMVVAGAFHEPERPDAPELAYNTAPVLTGNGMQLFAHRKLSLFGKADFGAEFAQMGNQLHVLLTPIGCMTVLICKDFMDIDPRVDNLLAEVPVDWIWVPSYGNETTLKAHKKRAKELATVTVGTSSAVANTQNTASKTAGLAQDLLPGFGHAGGKDRSQDMGHAGGLVLFSLAKQVPPPESGRPAIRRIK